MEQTIRVAEAIELEAFVDMHEAADAETETRLGLGEPATRETLDAIDLGVRTIVTETGEALENELQHYYRNIERFGFRRAYTRQNWVPAD